MMATVGVAYKDKTKRNARRAKSGGIMRGRTWQITKRQRQGLGALFELLGDHWISLSHLGACARTEINRDTSFLLNLSHQV